jgi:hypothetical protein
VEKKKRITRTNEWEEKKKNECVVQLLNIIIDK